jgi:hypothetical protein
LTVTGVRGDYLGMSRELECWDVDGAGQVRFGVVGDQLELAGTVSPAVAPAAVVVEELEPSPIAGQLELGEEDGC